MLIITSNFPAKGIQLNPLQKHTPRHCKYNDIHIETNMENKKTSEEIYR